ncbi:MAG: prepilin-type N-terminal cleavage/methylation domain-containing protein [Pseudomonadota bacterium]
MKSQGFTLIELIIILVIIGILAVSAAPIIIGDGGIQSQAVRERAVSVLRNIQLSAMQNTDQCVASVINTDRLGAPTSGDCSSGLSLSAGATEEPDRINTTNNVVVALNGGSLPITIIFDGLGRPTGNACAAGCTLTFSDNSATHSLCIESEGYIHPC